MDISGTLGDPPTTDGTCCAVAPENMYCEDGYYPVALGNTGDTANSGCLTD